MALYFSLYWRIRRNIPATLCLRNLSADRHCWQYDEKLVHENSSEFLVQAFFRIKKVTIRHKIDADELGIQLHKSPEILQ